MHDEARNKERSEQRLWTGRRKKPHKSAATDYYAVLGVLPVGRCKDTEHTHQLKTPPAAPLSGKTAPPWKAPGTQFDRTDQAFHFRLQHGKQ